MTTVAYRDGIMAADSCVTYGAIIMPCNITKVTKFANGSIFAYSGTIELGELLKRELARCIHEQDGILPDCDIDRQDNAFSAAIVQPDGEVLFHEGRTWIQMDVPYFALGSGKDYAYAAMYLGASAEQAVKCACTLDLNSGGKIKKVKIPWETERSSIQQIWGVIK